MPLRGAGGSVLSGDRGREGGYLPLPFSTLASVFPVPTDNVHPKAEQQGVLQRRELFQSLLLALNLALLAAVLA